MRKISTLILFVFSLVIVFGQCEPLKKEYTQLNVKFEKVNAKLASPDISKKEYDKLLKEYNLLWKKAASKKKSYEECIEGKKHKHKKLYNEGIELKRSKNYKAALKKFEEALKIKPDFKLAIEQVVEVAIYLKNSTKFNAYIKKVKDKKKKGKLYYKLALIYKKSSNTNKAIAAFKNAARYYKPYLSYLKAANLYVVKKGNKSQGIVYFKKSIKAKPTAKAYEALGATYFDTPGSKKQPRKKVLNLAISAFEKGMKHTRYKGYASLCARAAQAYNEKGQASKALKSSIKALSIDNKFSLAYLQKGIALIKMGKKDDAKAALLRAKKDFLTKSQAEYYLKSLEKK